MTFKIEESGNATTINAGCALTISQATELKKNITDALSNSDGLIIDLKNLSEFDLSCIQLLCSANFTFEKTGKKMTVNIAPGDFLREKLLQSGYTSKSGCFESPCRNCLWLEELADPEQSV